MVLYFYRSLDGSRGYVGRDVSNNNYKRLKDHVDDAYGKGNTLGTYIRAGKTKNRSAQIFLDLSASQVKYDFFTEEENFGIPESLYQEIFKNWVPCDKNGKVLTVDAAVKLYIAEIYYINYYSIYAPQYITENTTQGGEIGSKGRQIVFHYANKEHIKVLEDVYKKLQISNEVKIKSLAYTFYHQRVNISPYIRLIEPDISTINLWLIQNLNENFMKNADYWANIVAECFSGIQNDGTINETTIAQILHNHMREYWNSKVDLIASELKILSINPSDLKIHKVKSLGSIKKQIGGLLKHVVHVISNIGSASIANKEVAIDKLTKSILLKYDYNNWGKNYIKRNQTTADRAKIFLTPPKEPSFSNSEINLTMKKHAIWRWHDILQKIGEKPKPKEIKRVNKEKTHISEYFNNITLMNKFFSYIQNSKLKGIKENRKEFAHTLLSWVYGAGLSKQDGLYYSSLDINQKLPIRFHEQTKEKIELMKQYNKKKLLNSAAVPNAVASEFRVY